MASPEYFTGSGDWTVPLGSANAAAAQYVKASAANPLTPVMIAGIAAGAFLFWLVLRK